MRQKEEIQSQFVKKSDITAKVYKSKNIPRAVRDVLFDCGMDMIGE